MCAHAPVLVLGESVLDRVVRADGTIRETPGGSPANVAIGLARLGHPTRFVTQLADDSPGSLLRSHLAAAGVQVEATAPSTGRTSSALATLAADGSASYVFDLDFDLQSEVFVSDSAALHVGSVSAIIGSRPEQLCALMAHARANALVTYDINMRPALTGVGAAVRQRVEDLCAVADVVKASDEDLAALWPGHEPVDVAAHVLSLGARAVAVTLGAEGSLLMTARAVVRREAKPTTVVDTIGAGDSFMSGLIDSLAGREIHRLDAKDWAESLDHAAACAAYTVSHAGAAMPTRRDLER